MFGLLILANRQIVLAEVSDIPKDILSTTLSSTDGKPIQLEQLTKDKKILVAVAHGSGCPVIRQNYPDYERLRSQYANKGVVFVMVNGVMQDQNTLGTTEAKTFELKMNVILDPNQLLIKGLGLHTLGEAIVVDTRNWRILYRGPISDRVNFDRALPKAKSEFLKKAIDDVLAGRKVAIPSAPVFGCAITLKP